MPKDTTSAAAEMRAALLRRMTSDERTELAAELSMAMRAVALDGIRARHPGYDERQAQLALFRLLVGDELFRRAWPNEPLLAP